MSKPDSAGMLRVRAVLDKAAYPLTSNEIAARAHVSVWTFRNHYKRPLLSDGAMHVADWAHYGYGWTARYAKDIVGESPPKPKSPPPKAATAAWKKRTGYTDPRYAHRRLARPRDKVLAALMGLSA